MRSLLLGQETGNELEFVYNFALVLRDAAGCQLRNESLRHRSRYLCIDISEIGGVSGATAANPWTIGKTGGYARKQAYFPGKRCIGTYNSGR